MMSIHPADTRPIWRESTRNKPCPICGKPDWCGRAMDNGIEIVRCMRIDAETAGWRIIKRCDDGGTVFAFGDGRRQIHHRFQRYSIRRPDQHRHETRAHQSRPKLPASYWADLHARALALRTPRNLRWLADRLGVTESALAALEIGFADARLHRDHLGRLRDAGIITADDFRRLSRFARDTFAIPERIAGAVVGIATRDFNGRKYFLRGGSRGLIVPIDLADRAGRVLVPEGMSDVAACLSYGIAAVGRPSCVSPPSCLRDLATVVAMREIAIIGERDRKPDGRWPGRDGAQHDARAVARLIGQPVRWEFPPDGAKDLREFFAQHDRRTGGGA